MPHSITTFIVIFTLSYLGTTYSKALTKSGAMDYSKPPSPCNITVKPKSLNTSSFRLTWSPCSSEDKSPYVYNFKWEDIFEQRDRIYSMLNQRGQFEVKITNGILPGHTYQVFVKTLNNLSNISSDSISVNVTLKPLPVQNLRITPDFKSYEFIIQWDINNTSSQDTFVLNITDMESSKMIEHSILDSREYFSIPMTELSPETNYTINVWSISNHVKSEASSITYMTPSFTTKIPVGNVSSVNNETSSVTRGTTILSKTSVGNVSSVNNKTPSVTIIPRIPIREEFSPMTAQTLESIPRTTIEALWSEAHTSMPPFIPQPVASAFPTIDGQTSRTIRIQIMKNFFSEDYGPIIAYTLIVAENSSNLNTTKTPTGLSWHDVQSHRPWPPYQVSRPQKFFTNQSVEYYTIGQEECRPSVLYCNGPLKSGTAYRVKLRAFTHLDPDVYIDTMYSFPMYTNKDFTVVIVLCLVLTCIIVPALITIYRRVFVEKRCGSSTGFEEVILQLFSHSIPTNHFKTMLIEENTLWEEFENLKHVGKGQPTSAAELATNRPKNRFSNILPYDASRFKLQPVDDEDGSDYVNATYVPGHTSPRQYIATQGPLSGTQNEFWRMCWESKTPAIVMITQCVEKGRNMCYRYWPLGERAVRCGDIDVCPSQVRHYKDWSFTELRLSLGGEHRTLTHFHFTSWPDFGVPNNPATLVRFVRTFRARILPEQQPVVVHCSAGVGRTGTFIALDTVMMALALDNARSVDILSVVHRMRKARMRMVQTLEQYQLIYQCVQLVIQGLSDLPETLVHRSSEIELDEGVEVS